MVGVSSRWEFGEFVLVEGGEGGRRCVMDEDILIYIDRQGSEELELEARDT